MLTPRQAELLAYISAYLQRTGGVSPSFAEMSGALGFVSKSGVAALLDGLEERGFISRRSRRARAIEVLRPPYETVLLYRGQLWRYIPWSPAANEAA